MTVETFLNSSEGVITALASLVAAIGGVLALIAKLREPAQPVVAEVAPGQVAPPEIHGRRRREWPFFAGILLLQAFVVATSAGIGRYGFSPREAAAPAVPPRVEITTPLPEQRVDMRLSTEGSGSFRVSGSSSGVADDLERRVYVLIHPEEPSASGWWVQSQATVDPRSGDWTSHNWFGDRNFTPAPGHRLQLVAVVARPSAAPHVDDPKDLRPVAQSSIVSMTVGATRRE